MRLDSYAVPGKNLKVRANMRIASESLDGQTSTTDTAHKGFKAKVFTITLLLPFDQAEELTSLIRVAEAVDATGDRKVYAISDKTANALKVRQVKFSDNISTREAENLQAWQVSFVLTEHLSTPEKAEQKIETKTANAQVIDGEEIQAATEKALEVSQAGLTTVEKFFKWLDDGLKSDEPEENGEEESAS